MSEIDWSKAPEDATHYCPKGSNHEGVEYGEHWLKPGFYRLPGWKDWEEEKCRAPEDILIPRPSPAWNGEGLPPVGHSCEVNDTRTGSWQAVDEVVAHVSLSDRDVAVFRIGDYIAYSPADRFRPIRTPEQIAADEREAAINKMRDEIIRVVAWPSGQDARDYSAALYDAGYRKQEGK